MRFPTRGWLLVLALGGAAAAQTKTPAPPAQKAPPTPTPVATPVPTPIPTQKPTAAGYIVTIEVKALALEMKTPRASAPEAQALVEKLQGTAHLVSRIYLAQDMSRQEIVSTDFILPAGTLVMHKAGDRFYAIADPTAQTYLVMDSEQLLNALEGGAGILNSEYQAKVAHTPERKTIAGVACRKSIVTVTYVSSIPFENTRVLVQQKNDIEVWHTSDVVSPAAMDHFFFKFQRDKTGGVQKVLATEIGFPMEVNLVVTQGAGGKKATVQPGSLHMVVTEVKRDKTLDPELFRIPPAGYRKIEKNPYFKEGALSSAGARMAGEGQEKP